MPRFDLEQFFGLPEGRLLLSEPIGLVDLANQESDFVDFLARLLQQFLERRVSPILRNPLDDVNHLIVVAAAQTLADESLDRGHVAGVDGSLAEGSLIKGLPKLGCFSI